MKKKDSNGSLKKSKSIPKSNPFDFRKPKQKFAPSNVKAKRLNAIKATEKSQEKRKNTLFHDLTHRHKVGGFVDRRFGQHNPHISEEEKMLIRFQKTRQKQISKQSIYNLGEEDTLTHGGRALSLNADDVGHFNPGFGHIHDDDDDLDYQKHIHDDDDADDIDDFGGLSLVEKHSDMDDQNQSKYRTRNEIMQEVISKSKYHKYISQKELEERNELTQKLDDEFDEIKDLLAFQDKKKSNDEEGRNRKRNRKGQNKNEEESFDEGEEENINESDDENINESDDENISESDENNDKNDDHDDDNHRSKNDLPSKNISSSSISLSNTIPSPHTSFDDDYDRLTKLFSRPDIKKATASNPLKDEEEARRQKESLLKKLEEERLLRMNDGHPSLKKKKIQPSGDDLDDISSRHFLKNDDDDDDILSKYDLDSFKNELDDENINDSMSDHDDAFSDDDDHFSSHNKRMKKHDLDHSFSDSLPSRPLKQSKKDSLLDQFKDLVSSILSQSLTIHHMRDHSELSDFLKSIHKMTCDAVDISFQIKDDIIGFIREKVLDINERYSDKIKKNTHPSMIGQDAKNLDQHDIEHIDHPENQPLDDHHLVQHDDHPSPIHHHASKDTLPFIPLDDIFFFQLMGHIWSITDRRHLILSPISILMGHILSSSSIQTKNDMVLYYVLLNVFYTYIEGAKRYASEPINAIIKILKTFTKLNKDKKIMADQKNLKENGQRRKSTQGKGKRKSKGGDDLNEKGNNPIHENNEKNMNASNSKLSSPCPLLIFNDSLFDISNIHLYTNDTSISEPLSLLLLSDNFHSHKHNELKKKKKRNSTTPIPDSTTPISQNDSMDDPLKLRFIFVAVDLLSSFMNLYQDDIACIDLFIDHQEILKDLMNIPSIPVVIHDLCQKTMDQFHHHVNELKKKRFYLEQFTKKPEPLAQLTPDFQERYFGQKVTENKIKRDEKKLKKKLKSEQRGAEKELRLDSLFISQEKLKKRIKSDQERNKKTKEAFTFFENQQKEANELKRSKKRKSLSGL